MSSTMLQLIQQATGEMGLTQPVSVAGNASQDTVQQLALLNGLGNDLQRQYDWQRIDKEYRFTTVFYTYTGDTVENSVTVSNMSSIVGLTSTGTFSVVGSGINTDTYCSTATGSTVTLSQVASETATGVSLSFCQTKYTMPSDFDRWIDRTEWDKSRHWEMLGPETAQQWQWLKSGFISTGPRIRFRPLGGYFQIWPAQTVNDVLGFEYVSNQWVLSAAAIAAGVTPDKSSFTVDTDICVFPDRLMVLGLKLAYFTVKGFDTTNFQKLFDAELSISKANDSGSQTLSMAPRLSDTLLGWGNIPDSGYGV